MAETETTDRDEEIGWALLEVMGHRRLGGFVRIEQKAGVGFFRIDVPAANGHAAFTQWYHPNSLYCLTPVSEAVATAIAKSSPEPATRWELTAIEANASPRFGDASEDYYAGDIYPVDDEEDEDEIGL